MSLDDGKNRKDGDMKRWMGIMVLFCCFIMLNGEVLHAGISVKPSVIEKVLKPGKSEEGVYTVRNDGEAKLVVSVEIEDWMARLFGRPDEMNVNDWLSVEPKEVTLGPGEAREIRYKVKAPKNLANEKVAQVFFAYSENEMLQQRLGVIFYLSPKGAEKLKADITQLKAQYITPPNVEPKVRVSLGIKNDSNFHVRAPGSLIIFDEKNQKVLKELVMDRIPGVYPGQTFDFNYDFPQQDIPEGIYKAKVKLNYGKIYGKEAWMEKTVDLEWVKEPVTP